MTDRVQIGNFNFRFQCQSGCTNCCTQPGEVYLTEEDVERIAAYLNADPDEFRESYCETDAAGDLQLQTPDDKACHFLLEDGCSIHEAKPLQCRTFPYWPQHVRHRRAWKGLSKNCPGVGVGPIVPVEEVRSAAQACQDAFPDS